MTPSPYRTPHPCPPPPRRLDDGDPRLRAVFRRDVGAHVMLAPLFLAAAAMEVAALVRLREPRAVLGWLGLATLNALSALALARASRNTWRAWQASRTWVPGP